MATLEQNQVPMKVHRRDCGDHDTPIEKHGDWCRCPCHRRRTER